MKQFTRIYLTQDKQVAHVHTNLSPFDFEPIEDEGAPFVIDVILETNRAIDASEIFTDLVAIDGNDLPVFTKNRDLIEARIELVKGFHKRF